MKLRRRRRGRRALCRWEDAFTEDVRRQCLADPAAFPLQLFHHDFIHGCLTGVREEYVEENPQRATPWSVWAKNKAAESESARDFVKYMTVTASAAIRRRMIEKSSSGSQDEPRENPEWVQHLVEKFG